MNMMAWTRSSSTRNLSAKIRTSGIRLPCVHAASPCTFASFPRSSTCRRRSSTTRIRGRSSHWGTAVSEASYSNAEGNVWLPEPAMPAFRTSRGGLGLVFCSRPCSHYTGRERKSMEIVLDSNPLSGTIPAWKRMKNHRSACKPMPCGR